MTDTCTCGIPIEGKYKHADHYDITGKCERGNHAGTDGPPGFACDGTLRFAVGFHWWCICDCHPVPVSFQDATADEKTALEVFLKARKVRSANS